MVPPTLLKALGQIVWFSQPFILDLTTTPEVHVTPWTVESDVGNRTEQVLTGQVEVND